MKYICSWSGGKDSTATIILAHLHNEPIDEIIMSEVMFDNKRGISGELPEHINWVKEVAIPKFKEWGYKTTLLHSEKDYIQEFFHIVKRGKYAGKYSGFVIGGMCVANRDLKVQPIKDYFKGQDTVQYIGIAIDEPKRLARLKDNKISLLEKYGYTEQMAFELCKEYGLLNPIYEFSKRGGCWFCPNQRLKEFARVKETHPELWNELSILAEAKSECKCLDKFAYEFSFREIDREVDKYIYLKNNQITMF